MKIFLYYLTIANANIHTSSKLLLTTIISTFFADRSPFHRPSERPRINDRENSIIFYIPHVHCRHNVIAGSPIQSIDASTPGGPEATNFIEKEVIARGRENAWLQ